MFVTVSFPAASCLRKPFRSWYRYMRIDVVTDTYEPDVNGVALTLGRLVGGGRHDNLTGDQHGPVCPPSDEKGHVLPAPAQKARA